MLKKNRSILYITLTIVFIILVVGCFYFLRYKKIHLIDESKEKNGLVVTFNSSQHISLKNILPMSDELGMGLNNKSVERGGYGYIMFSVKNQNSKKTNYKIYIDKNESEFDLIDEKFINFYLTDENNNSIGLFENENVINYSDLNALSSKPFARLIYDDILDSNEEKHFILRTWLSDEYEMIDKNETFDFDIFVESQ